MTLSKPISSQTLSASALQRAGQTPLERQLRILLLLALVSTLSVVATLGPRLLEETANPLKTRSGKRSAPVAQDLGRADLRDGWLVAPQVSPSRQVDESAWVSSPAVQPPHGAQSSGLRQGQPETSAESLEAAAAGESASFNHPLNSKPGNLSEPGWYSGAGLQPSEADIERGLLEFAARIAAGDGTRLAGLYVHDQAALTIVQQPARSPAFVSSEPETVTQFSLASEYGSIGLLAHNSYAGSLFHNFQAGQSIHLVYGDGAPARYRIIAIRHMQALAPKSLQSDFLDLDNGSQRLTALELFNQVYAQPDRLVLQTCIAAEGIGAWGRLFVIAAPEDGPEFRQALSQ